MAGLHFIEEQKDILFVAELSQTEKIFRRRGSNSAFALDRFHQDRRGLRRHRGAHRVEIVEWHLAEAGHHRLETLFDLFLTRRGDARQSAPVKRTVRGDDLVPALVVPEFSRELEQAFVRLRAAVAEKAPARADQPNERFRELGLRLGEIKIRDVQELSRLLEQRIGDFRIGVAQRTDGDAAAEIEVALARHIPDVAPLAVIEREIEARVRRDDICLKKLPDIAEPVGLDRFDLP